MGHLRDIVAPNVGKSRAYLLAQDDPCINIAAAEKKAAYTRRFSIIEPEHLKELDTDGSWIMAVLLCPGDDTIELSRWFTHARPDVNRIHFYLHRATDPRHALQAWHEKRLPTTSTWTIARWQDLHPHLGAAWNQLVHDDFCTFVDCPLR